MREGHTLGNQRVNRRSHDVRVAKSADRVKTLLVGAVPENVGAIDGGQNERALSSDLSGSLVDGCVVRSAIVLLTQLIHRFNDRFGLKADGLLCMLRL